MVCKPLNANRKTGSKKNEKGKRSSCKFLADIIKGKYGLFLMFA
jgi:hypothetical protein